MSEQQDWEKVIWMKSDSSELMRAILRAPEQYKAMAFQELLKRNLITGYLEILMYRGPEPYRTTAKDEFLKKAGFRDFVRVLSNENLPADFWEQIQQEFVRKNPPLASIIEIISDPKTPEQIKSRNWEVFLSRNPDLGNIRLLALRSLGTYREKAIELLKERGANETLRALIPCLNEYGEKIADFLLQNNPTEKDLEQIKVWVESRRSKALERLKSIRHEKSNRHPTTDVLSFIGHHILKRFPALSAVLLTNSS